MVELCFVLDLRSLPPPFLRDLKQSLLQLANLYAISSPAPWGRSESLRDRIGLCYVFQNPISLSDEMKIVYTPSPSGNFNLRDFHHAVNNLPAHGFRPQIDDSDVKLSSVLSDQVLYHWGGKDIMRKVIVITSCLPRDVDFVMQKTLTAAAEKCVSVDFVLFEQRSSHLSNTKENINNFQTCISDLDNCSFQAYLPDVKVLHGLVNRWLQDLKDDIEEPLQARFNFKNNLVGSVNQISCNLYISVNPIIDGFYPCQTCRCHGISLEDAVRNRSEELSCPVTGCNLGRCDVIENSVKVGVKTILLLPSFPSSMKLKSASSPIDFNVIERTNMGSLSEGVIMGASYVVIPSTFHEIETSLDEVDRSELNTQRYKFAVFSGICSALHSMDQCLLCSSNCNVESMTEATLHCYYILQPSGNGPMLLRRIAGLEEVLHIPNLNQLTTISSVHKEIENSIKESLSKIDVRDYNPLLHERGFHQNLNLLVKESLQLGSIAPGFEEKTYESNATEPKLPEVVAQSNSTIDLPIIRNETSHFDPTAIEDKASACITEEWEKLIVNEVSDLHSPVCTSKPKLDQSVLSPPDGNRQLDAKTSRILERLEVPRQFKRESVSPILTNNAGGTKNPIVEVKRPLIPSRPISAPNQPITGGQLMKPNFQRLKRKHK
ncbi:hypothetical protein D8674_029308 [Pyrus ussuriensis x Pyrus communis]|uniref:Uncharacterized protein n=1 Tax=Pyrus ussuriensis x Pyrus communis TaxID=2448454 RepID=A0A5N5I3H5_9ROSA|nr:hypothetical protein D8674_029308 [Pyrus ussuriensis x Pyrus communis]